MEDSPPPTCSGVAAKLDSAAHFQTGMQQRGQTQPTAPEHPLSWALRSEFAHVGVLQQHWQLEAIAAEVNLGTQQPEEGALVGPCNSHCRLSAVTPASLTGIFLARCCKFRPLRC
eukprot:3662087-Amphidinium_carterae.2